ncbi:hypothetical protein O181_058482 [Austropuccinia psidii MF-1]|uniref:Sugar phosphate phosphatase n=1 Tax=Austropuccinia psidii MF-1 TaxID=1389203 RepID=A0A9Q3EER4_9BASI|nr:hypothetical protein [Austropuccinia psidii MF-1]
MKTTIFPNSSHKSIIEPYSASDSDSFAYISVTRRWPIILTQVIDKLVVENNSLLDNLSFNPSSLDQDQSKILKEKLTQGKFIISQISELKYESARNKEIKLLNEENQIQSELETEVTELYNQEILRSKAACKSTWFTASWLLTECYLYQRLHGFFKQHQHWNTYDPFEHQKLNNLKSSWNAIITLSLKLNQFIQNSSSTSDPVTCNVLFDQFNQLLNASLWGNASDLSLLPNMTYEEIQYLQSISLRKPQSILRDDSKLTWDSCLAFQDNEQLDKTKQIQLQRVDFVLDNSGFELFTDLVLADWIVSNSNARIVFHPKMIPWFVSDVMKKDIEALIDQMIEPKGFFKINCSVNSDETSLDDKATELDEANFKLISELGTKWKGYFQTEVWKVIELEKMKFWTNPLPFWDIYYRDPTLLEELKSSNLVIFKGDLNYRKLTGDCRWPSETRFEEAVGPLNGLFNLLSLRTCKADVVVGLNKGQAEELDEIDEDWRINGKFGLITFIPKED